MAIKTRISAALVALRRRLASQSYRPIARGLWHFANTPFGLWLLSAIVVAAVGWYYTNFQECVRQADSFERSIFRLWAEAEARRSYLREGILTAKTLDDVHALLERIPYVYREYKDATLRDLDQEENLLSRYLVKPTGWKDLGALPQPLKDGLWDGSTESDLAQLKETIRTLYTKDRRLGYVRGKPGDKWLLVMGLTRDCGLHNLIQRASGNLYVPIMAFEDQISIRIDVAPVNESRAR